MSITDPVRTISDRVREIIIKNTGKDPNVLGHDAAFLDVYKLDSLDFINLVLLFEQEFGVKIPDTDLPKLVNFKITIEYIKMVKA